MVNGNRFSLLPLMVLAWGWGLATSGLAAERLKLRLGPLEQSVEIAEVERFVKTGELSPALRPYALVLTPNMRQSLGQGLQLNPTIASQAVDDLLRSPTGQRLLQVLGVVVQDTTPQQLRLGLKLAARQAKNINLVNFLKAYPEKTVTIDATSALAVASQLNLKYLESQAINPILKRDLGVASGRSFSSRLNPTQPGPQAVQTQTLTLQDQQRDRTIPVDLYWAANTQAPLVVMSHGFGADRRFLAYLARHLASYGFTVASLEHPGSNAASIFTRGAVNPTLLKDKSLLPAREFVERPRDVSFLLDQLAQQNRLPGLLHNKFNTNQVSVIGHSLGGYTALALAGAELDLDNLRAACKTQNPLGLAPADWLECGATRLRDRQLDLRDRRVVQVTAINPLIGNLFGPNGLRGVRTSTLVVSSTKDTVTPALSNQLRPFTQLPSPKYLLTAIGATHLSINDPTSLSQESTFVKERLGPEVAPLQQLLQGVSLGFVQQLTPQARAYQPFLTSDYAQALSTPELPLRLTTELPTSITPLL